jgi:hypothetical protein
MPTSPLIQGQSQPELSPAIRVNGGVVETRDPTHFGEGELLVGQDAYYKPNNPALWAVPGRVAFNNVPAGGAIIGGRYLEYDGAADFIVIRLGAKIREVVAGLTGTFADAVTSLTATGVTSFDSCHYNNQHILMDGVNRNLVRLSTGTYIFHGMLATTTVPTVANTGSGTGFNLSSGSVISYWIEERYKDGTGAIVKRNALLDTSLVAVLSGPQTLVKPVITRPAIVNSDATHWAVYATASIGGVVLVGAEIGEEVVANSTIEDTRIGTDPGLPAGDTYETVAVVLPGTTVTELFARNGPPPISTTADVQEDSIVMTDVGDKSKVWFTFPDNIHATPPVNFIHFETKEADEVQWVRFLGQATIVALRDSIWKINILPESSDSTFQVNRIKSQIEGAHGGIGPLTVAPFSFGEKNLLAYISRAGVFVTDGEVWNILTGDINWLGRVDITKLSQATLLNNPLNFRLEMTYTPLSTGVLNSETLFLHYHPSHIKTSPLGLPQAKVTVPIRRGGLCKFEANIGGKDVIFSGQSNGRLYQEWIGFEDPLGTIEFEVRTGERFAFGIGRWGRCRRSWVHHQASIPTERAEVFIVARTEGYDDVLEARSIPLKRREHTSFYADIFGEAFQYGVRTTNPQGEVGVDFFLGEFTSDGIARLPGEE